MKRSLSLKSFLGLILLIIFFVGCSKENPGISNLASSPVKNDKLNVLGNSAKPVPMTFGSISGKLYPIPAKAVIRAINDHFISEETVMNLNGSFTIQNLPPDYYHLLISYVPINYPDYLIFRVYKIMVDAGQETNVGQVNLPG